MATVLNLQPVQPERARRARAGGPASQQVDAGAPLLPYAPQLLFALHLAYEDLKLDTLLSADLEPLSAFLYQVTL